MAFNVIFKVLAQIEVAEACQWYRQPDIQMGDAFLFELERTSSFLASNPYLYPKVEQVHIPFHRDRTFRHRDQGFRSS